MRRALLLGLLLTIGCTDEPATADAGGDVDACDPAMGTLEVCIYGDETSTEPIGGEATARRSEDDVPFIMRTGDDGCARELLEVGTWEVSADDGSGTCTTPFEVHEIRPCEATSVRAEVYGWCVDG